MKNNKTKDMAKYQREWRLKNREHIGEWRQRNRENLNKYRKEYRHRKGISKNYGYSLNGGIKLSEEQIKERIKFRRKRYKYSFKNGTGKLSVQVIQLVYEDNIKKYGTLTCYLCEKPIEIGTDHFEHKTPLVMGGTNEYNNLAIACQRCNRKKHNRTEDEFRKER